MTVGEARQLGAAKLNVDRELFDACFRVAQRLDGARAQDMGPVTLALAVMGAAKAQDSDELENELGDALDLVGMAEKEWRLELSVGGRGRVV